MLYHYVLYYYDQFSLVVVGILIAAILGVGLLLVLMFSFFACDILQSLDDRVVQRWWITVYTCSMPIMQVVLGGGQEAMDVTTTSTRIGKFDARFYHMIFEEEFGRIKGHFGPINSITFHPDGKG